MSVHHGVAEGWLTWPFEALSLPLVAPWLLIGQQLDLLPTFWLYYQHSGFITNNITNNYKSLLSCKVVPFLP